MSKLADEFNGMFMMVDDINNTDTILTQRAARYGKFIDNARIAQSIKQWMEEGTNWDGLHWDQREALHQIASKISRIVTGDIDYVDNWDDIAGYASLVAERLRGVER